MRISDDERVVDNVGLANRSIGNKLISIRIIVYRDIFCFERYIEIKCRFAIPLFFSIRFHVNSARIIRCIW